MITTIFCDSESLLFDKQLRRLWPLYAK